MLRISYTDAGPQSGSQQRWNLCGRLAGPWVDELRTLWQYARKAAPATRAIVDLRDVTFIDQNGENLLSEMNSDGVVFVAAGIETKYLLENLNQARNQ